jgi:SWIM zinc finger
VSDDDIVIIASNHRVVLARVRDGAGGVYDVVRTAADGYRCSCAEPGGPCAHILAVAQTTTPAVVPSTPQRERAVRDDLETRPAL